MSTSVSVNYDDQRFKDVEADKKAAINEIDKTYGDMIGKSDDFYKAQIDASKEWADKQTQLQQEKTDFAIEKIEQQKAQAKKDYTKEQSGAYVDWQKQKNDYGSNAEKQADAGLASSGFSESSQVSMYNTYQNRVMTAREGYNNALLNYNNAIKDARLQNNSALAEIAYKALQQQLELSLQGFQYKNQLLIAQADKKTEAEQMYHTRYQDVLKQINTENALAEQIRQHNEDMALKKAQLAEEQRQFNYKNSLGEFASSGGGGGGGGSSRSSSGSSKSSSSKSSGSASINKSSGNSGSSNKSSGATVNTASVLNLGRGPISGSYLAELENEGKVTSKQVGNQIYFKNTNTGKASSYFKGKTGKF